jgi:disulfide bond formation protein DsbB
VGKLNMSVTRHFAHGNIRDVFIMRLLNLAALVGLLVVLGVLLWFEFAMGEMPCALFLIQRSAMFGLAVGPMMNLLWGMRPAHYGVSILAACVGGAGSVCQILLHIANPDDPGHGPVVFGFHLYTWAFITFATGIVGCAILLLFKGQFEAGDTGVLRERGWLRLFTIAIITWVTLNLAMLGIGVLPDCGLGMCPTDPATSVGIGTVGGCLMFLAIILASFATGAVLNRRMQSVSSQ